MSWKSCSGHVYRGAFDVCSTKNVDNEKLTKNIKGFFSFFFMRSKAEIHYKGWEQGRRWEYCLCLQCFVLDAGNERHLKRLLIINLLYVKNSWILYILLISLWMSCLILILFHQTNGFKMDYNVRTSFDVRLEIELFGVSYHSLMQILHCVKHNDILI